MIVAVCAKEENPHEPSTRLTFAFDQNIDNIILVALLELEKVSNSPDMKYIL